MLDTRLLTDNVVVREYDDPEFHYEYAHKLVTRWLDWDKRREEMGCVGVCSPNRARLLTAAEQQPKQQDGETGAD